MELLYADDLVLMAETLKLLEERIVKWKNGMEGMGLRVNMGKKKYCDAVLGWDRWRTLESGHVVFARKVLLQTQYNAPHVGHGFIRGVVVLLAS